MHTDHLKRSNSKVVSVVARLVGMAVVLASLVAFRPLAALAAGAAPGAVYIITNSTAGNAVLAFDRAANGDLTPAGSYATGGLGAPALGSQGALVLTNNQRWLLAVNAGSNDISVFAVEANGLS